MSNPPSLTFSFFANERQASRSLLTNLATIIIHYHHCVPHLKVFKCSEKGFGRKQGGGRLMPSIRVNRASIRDVNGARPLIIMERYPASLFHKGWQNAVYLKLFLTIAMLRPEQQQLWMVYCDKREVLKFPRARRRRRDQVTSISNTKKPFSLSAAEVFFFNITFRHKHNHFYTSFKEHIYRAPFPLSAAERLESLWIF